MQQKTAFAPVLIIANGVSDVSFYTRAFNAMELRRFTNDDGTIHVVEMTIDGQLFHLHEQTKPGKASPEKLGGTTVEIGLFVDDVDASMSQSIEAGATMTSAAQDFFYGYRQGEIIDPFGHRWVLQKVILVGEE